MKAVAQVGMIETMQEIHVETLKQRLIIGTSARVLVDGVPAK